MAARGTFLNHGPCYSLAKKIPYVIVAERMEKVVSAKVIGCINITGTEDSKSYIQKDYNMKIYKILSVLCTSLALTFSANAMGDMDDNFEGEQKLNIPKKLCLSEEGLAAIAKAGIELSICDKSEREAAKLKVRHIQEKYNISDYRYNAIMKDISSFIKTVLRTLGITPVTL